MDGNSLEELRREVVECTKCPRLVEYRETVAEEKRKAFEDEDYWGKPVPGFGDQDAALLIVGLAPAAHGANRTGRMFTGDASSEFLMKHLHAAGFANQAVSSSRNDGLELDDAWITAPVKCAPPDNKPLTDEVENCSSYLHREFRLLDDAIVTLTLGGFAFRWVENNYPSLFEVDTSGMEFSHGAVYHFEDPAPSVFASYHPSPRNTYTGVLTEEMFLNVLEDITSFLY